MEMINIKLLGYEIKNIGNNLYDATEVFENENLINVIVACDTENYDIIKIDKHGAIVKKL